MIFNLVDTKCPEDLEVDSLQSDLNLIFWIRYFLLSYTNSSKQTYHHIEVLGIFLPWVCLLCF